MTYRRRASAHHGDHRRQRAKVCKRGYLPVHFTQASAATAGRKNSDKGRITVGIFRLYLALSVLNGHYQFSRSGVFLQSFSAVCCFFVISGFYMSMVLNENYNAANGLLRFYLNRVLRLYPVYLVVLAILAVASALGAAPPVLGLPSSSWAIVDQILIFPNVLWQNLTLHPGVHSLTFGQMYTVALELMFYAVAPCFVTRRPPILAAITAVAIGLHFGLRPAGEPRYWQYEFFPGTFAFFCIGSMSYRFWLVVRDWRYPRSVGIAALPALLAYCVLLHDKSYHGFSNEGAIDSLYVVTALLVPFIFGATSSVAWDRFIGDLSYPVYVVHFLVGAAIVGLPTPGYDPRNLYVLVGVMAAAVGLVMLVDYPVDWLRKRVRSSPSLTHLSWTQASAPSVSRYVQ